ncbi:flagella basal body P-ring formation protein FlgA [Sphingomonas sp. GlSt437]
MTRRSIHLAMVALAATCAAPSTAQSTFQDTTALDMAVEGFTGRPVGTEGGARAAVDKRLKLGACPTVALSWYGATHDAVMIRCGSPEWRLFVPVIAAPPAPAPAGVPLVPVSRPVVVIKRGDPVTIEVNAPGFVITRDGIAMSDAVQGGRFLVDVDGNGKKPVQAVALEAGRATLPGWTN